ncbi:MAG TPA: Fic family protein [Steroidobacteraceae bacterium]|nr:Fic family protein [Steroidobacteraceae bacterium]
MTTRKYEASGVEAEFEPGSRNRVLRNLLGIVREADMDEAESESLDRVYEESITQFGPTHRFSTRDIRDLHAAWLGPIYSWAGEYRTLNIGKGGFLFAHAARIPVLMEEFESELLRLHTPCTVTDHLKLAGALAEVHAELILIHPFRDGNGRLARLLAVLMALQAGLPQLDFSALDGSGGRAYIGAIHAALDRNYAPLTDLFRRVIEQTVASSRQ